MKRVVVACVCIVPGLVAQDWPAFRGPAGDGVAPVESAPLRWGVRKNVKWRAPLPKPANGSPIVSNGRVFLTAAEDDDGKRRSLYCFDRDDGKRLWVRTVEFDRVMPTHKTNPYGGSTPAADGQRVVVWHASAGLYCYDFGGKELWKRDYGEFRHRWGYGTSPVIHEGRVLLHTGPGRRVFVTALRIEDGKTIWRTGEPIEGDGQDNAEKRLMGSWCTPLVHEAGDVELVLCTMPTRVVAYDFESGDIVWTCSGLSCKRGDLAYSSPIVAGDLCMVMGGYEGPSLAVRLGGEGDVTKTRRVWRRPNQPSNVGSGVYAGGFIYWPDTRGFVACIDPASGERRWSERIGKGQQWGSIVLAAGHLYLTNQRGTTIVFRPNPEKLEVVAENELKERTNSTPAFSDGEIFLRTHEHLYCIAE